jgi:CRP-like cAMP-binding protein
MPPTNSYTGKNRLLKALPGEDFARFFSSLEPVNLPLRRVVQDTAQPVEYVYFIEEGVTSILAIMSDASAIEVGMIGTEGMVGVASLLDTDAAIPHVGRVGFEISFPSEDDVIRFHDGFSWPPA